MDKPRLLGTETPAFPFNATDVAPGRLARFAYCAYGSNLHDKQMAWRCPRARVVGRARLIDFRLVFRRVADVVFHPGHEVPVGLYRVTEECVRALDRYEGFPRVYERRFVLAHTEDGPVWSFIYVMRERPISPPTPEYLRTIRRGYEGFDLPTAPLARAVREAQAEAGVVGRSPPAAQPAREVDVFRRLREEPSARRLRDEPSARLRALQEAAALRTWNETSKRHSVSPRTTATTRQKQKDKE